MNTVLILNPQWQGWGASDSIADGARQLAHRLVFESKLQVPVPGYHNLDVTDGVLGLDEQVEQIEWLLHRLDQDAPETLVQVAGDCGAQLGPVGWLNTQHAGRLNLIWVDAHADLNTPATSPSATFHGTVLRTLLGEGHPTLASLVSTPINPRLVQLVGVRSLDDGELEYILKSNRRTVAVNDVAASGPVYVHIDLDSLDPDEFGHVPFPEPDGLLVAEIATMVHRLIDDPGCNVVGIGITESTAVDANHAAKIDPILAASRRLLT